MAANHKTWMAARKLVYRLMVCGPAFFLVGLAVNARTLSDDHYTLSYDAVTENAVQAYAPYLRESRTFLPGASSKPSAQEARSAAEKWLDGAQRKILKPLGPVAYEDTSGEGAKAQIFEVQSAIATRLLEAARQAKAQGQIHQAVLDDVTVLRLANVLRDSDLLSVFNAANNQRRALLDLVEMHKKLDDADRRYVLSVLPEIPISRRAIDHMATRSRTLFVSWRNRTGSAPLSIEDTNLLSEMPTLAASGDTATLKRVRTRLLASEDNDLPTYCSSLQLAISSKEFLDKDLAKLKALLESKD